MNVDIFTCIHFRGFTKFGIFAWIKIRVLRINGSSGYDKSNFVMYIFLQIFKKREITRKYVQRESVYVHST